MPGDALCGMRLLLVEDDYLLASTLQAAFELEGAAVVGSYAGVDAALDGLGKVPTVDAALLDVDLDGEMSFPVADALRERHVPVLFLTGYDDSVLPAAYDDVRRCQKPIDIDQLVQELQACCADAAEARTGILRPS